MDEPRSTIRLAELDDEDLSNDSQDSASTETAVSSNDDSLKNPPVLEGEVVSITGTLASMTHEQAYEQIVRHGGTASQHVTHQLTLLVVGEEGWPLESDGKPSLKLQQAEAFNQEGENIRIVNESDCLRMLGLSIENPDVKRLYTPAMLSRLLQLPVHVIRSWERAGLIRAEKKVFRLPYFSYHEVTTARRLCELMQAGATEQQLTRSLNFVQRYVGDPGRIFEQLEMLSDHRRLVMRDEHGYYEPQSRQRLFIFDQSAEAETDAGTISAEDLYEESSLLRFETDDAAPRSAKDWVIEGCRQAEVADTSGAIRSFRKALQLHPDDAEAHFYLADALYRLGKLEAALERYLSATEHDPEYLEAWTQIGCIYAELRKFADAIEAFDAAIEVHAPYAEAHLHKAETLHQMQRIEEAIRHWHLYLEYDDRGPWAELAYQRLEQFGVEIDHEE